MAATDPIPADGTTRTSAVRDARGGISGGAVLTGVVVAFGAMTLLSALVAGVVTWTQAGEDAPFPGTAIEGSIATGVLVVVAQLLSYLWGGYTAGRMARGSGLGNGLLVPLVAVLLVLVIGAIVGAVAEPTASLSLPGGTYQLAIPDGTVEWGAVIGIAALVAMFVGGGAGGLLGTRWHTRLERDAVALRTDPPGVGGSNTA